MGRIPRTCTGDHLGFHWHKCIECHESVMRQRVVRGSTAQKTSLLDCTRGQSGAACMATDQDQQRIYMGPVSNCHRVSCTLLMDRSCRWYVRHALPIPGTIHTEPPICDQSIAGQNRSDAALQHLAAVLQMLPGQCTLLTVTAMVHPRTCRGHAHPGNIHCTPSEFPRRGLHWGLPTARYICILAVYCLICC